MDATDTALTEFDEGGLRPGTIVLGQYRIEKPLGWSERTAVWLAEDLALRRLVALKWARGGVSELRQRERLEREARVLAKVDHPLMTSVLFVGEFRKVPFLVMKYVEGTTLEQRLAEGASYSAIESIGILRQMASVLDAIHRLHIAHCDVQPSNLLVTSAAVTLVDFGSAIQWLESETRAEPRAWLHQLYGAPEYLTGGPVVGTADQYSLALVAHLLLAGHLPWDTEEEEALVQLKLDGFGESALSPQLSRRVRSTLSRALNPRSSRRFATTLQFVSALSDALSLGADEPRRFRVFGFGRRT
jgi:serine/threonine-protein kinase